MMNKTFPILAIAVCGLISAGSVHAQDSENAASGPPPNPEPAGAAVVKHVLVSTFIDQSTKLFGLPKGNTVYLVGNAIPFTCATSCTLEVDAMVQLGGNTKKGNVWDISAQVDKISKNFSTAFQGTLPIDKSFVIGNYAWSVSLAKGAHTAESTVFILTGPVALGTFHFAYRVYQP
jgi:hypothetical protein